MFGDENQNKLTITNAMKIAIVDSEGSNNEANTICIVDLSNNLKSVPSGLGTFSNDASAQGDSISAVLSIK